MASTKLRQVCKLAPVAFLSASFLASQTFPDAATLAQRGIEALTAYSSLEFTLDISTRTKADAPLTVRSSAHFRFKQGKFLLQMGSGPNPDLVAVMDGKNLWTYTRSTGQYGKTPPESSAAAARQLILQFAGPRRVEPTAEASKVVRSEVIQIDGKPHDCWVTEGNLPIPGAKDGRIATESIWYDKTLHLILKKENIQSLPTAPFSQPTLAAKEELHGLRINSPLDDSQFSFTPPSGATEAATTAGTSPRISTGSLVLIKRVEPVYPPPAKAARVEGTVTFNATIGKDGAVQDLNVVSGHPMLIQAATAAVVQWVYKPTLVNGNPVEVHTTISVNFNLASSTATPQ